MFYDLPTSSSLSSLIIKLSAQVPHFFVDLNADNRWEERERERERGERERAPPHYTVVVCGSTSQTPFPSRESLCYNIMMIMLTYRLPETHLLWMKKKMYVLLYVFFYMLWPKYTVVVWHHHDDVWYRKKKKPSPQPLIFLLMVWLHTLTPTSI